jgi:hypothetical protein
MASEILPLENEPKEIQEILTILAPKTLLLKEDQWDKVAQLEKQGCREELSRLAELDAKTQQEQLAELVAKVFTAEIVSQEPLDERDLSERLEFKVIQ